MINLTRNLIIIGASGHGKVAVDVANQMNKWEHIYFLDDNNSLNEVYGISVLGGVDRAKVLKDDCDFFIAIGDNDIRQKVYERLVEFGVDFISLIHPNSIISDSVLVGEGTIVMPGVVINAHSIIGKCCIINTSSSVDHDNNIGDFVHVAPGSNVGGNVCIGDKVWLGLGSKVINNIAITNDVMFGAGSVSIMNITEPGTYVGVPATKVK